jgi:RNAse (barnase) inhibitor barstar
MTSDELGLDAPGGVVEAGASADLDAIAADAAGRGALVARLAGPASKEELLDMLARELAFPAWFGRNWDALDELLRYPEPPDDRPILIVWDDVDRLESIDPDSASTAHDIFVSAAEERSAAGASPLILITRRGAQ